MEYYIKEIKQNRSAPRIYLDNAQAARAGFAPGDTYEIRQEDGRRLSLIAHKDGSRTVTGRVNPKTGQKSIPVIDINSHKILSLFEGMDAVRMIVRPGAIIFLPLASEIAKEERMNRLAEKVAKHQPLLAGSLTHGVGILAHAIHTGLNRAGVKADLAFANEIREDLIDHARVHNPSWSVNTMGLAAPMQELVQDQWLMSKLPKLEILDMSLPCSGASKAGASKLGLSKMEDHEHVGHLAFAALVIISHVQPAILVLENVVSYSNSGSAQILRKQLRDMGYNIHETQVSGKDFGCIEDRVRWCMVATTEGIEFSFDNIVPAITQVTKIKDIVDESIGPDDPSWSRNEGLKAKEQRDIAAGKGFRLPIVNLEDTHVPTIRAGYQKRGSCDVQLAHPTDPDLSRLFTGDEHARLKGNSLELLGETSDAFKHRTLGQAVQERVFQPIGQRMGEALLAAKPYAQRKRVEAIRAISNGLQDGMGYSDSPQMIDIVKSVAPDVAAQAQLALDGGTVIEQPKPRRKRLGGGGIG